MTANAARASLNGLPKTHGTTILFQHNGLPRNPFYAERHLKGLFENLGVPSSIAGPLSSLRYQYSNRIRSALKEAGEFLPLEESHRRFGNELSKKLEEVLPEFGPFKTEFSYLYHEPYIPEVIRGIIDQGTDRLIAVSLYPFEIPRYLKPMKKATKNALKKNLSEVFDFKSGKKIYVAQNKPTSFEFQRIDFIGSHPSFIEYWSERLFHHFDTNPEDSVVFAVPLPISLWKRFKYYEAVADSAERIMIKCHERLSRAISYRVAFYTPWDHSVPLIPISRSIKKQMDVMKMCERKRPLIVPFGSLFKDFDSEYILPTNCPQLTIMRPDNTVDSNLAHSFVELLKSRILTEKYESDKVPVDPVF